MTDSENLLTAKNIADAALPEEDASLGDVLLLVQMIGRWTLKVSVWVVPSSLCSLLLLWPGCH